MPNSSLAAITVHFHLDFDCLLGHKGEKEKSELAWKSDHSVILITTQTCTETHKPALAYVSSLGWTLRNNQRENQEHPFLWFLFEQMKNREKVGSKKTEYSAEGETEREKEKL